MPKHVLVGTKEGGRGLQRHARGRAEATEDKGKRGHPTIITIPNYNSFLSTRIHVYTELPRTEVPLNTLPYDNSPYI